MELREKIATIIQDAPEDGVEPFVAEQAADRILAIPEIAEALGRSYKGMVIVEDASLEPGEIKLVQPPNA